MARKLPAHLRLHVNSESSSATENTSREFTLTAAFAAFAEATGWQVRPNGGTPHHPSAFEDAVGRTNGDSTVRRPLRDRYLLVSTQPMDGMLDICELDQFHGASEADAWNLLEHIDRLVQELKSAELTIASQEAQLSTSLGVSVRKDEAEMLASRMNESLHRAAELTGSDAAALYLLDDSTSELKMRSCWGLPSASLRKPSRDLRGSMADLEALLGNAVLLENTALAKEWSCPENFAAAMCVPVGSPTMPHGTLWLWSEHVRDFSSADIDAAKAACDKILVDIERSVLADEVLRTRSLDRQFNSASIVQSSRLPNTQPLHSDYEIGGWTFQGQALGGNFHNWTINRQRLLCAAIGAAATHGAAGALVATSLQTVIETCWNSNHKPSQVLRKANDILWAAEDGDWRSALCYLQIHPATGSTILGMAGNLQAFVVGCRGFRRLGGTPTSLGVQPDSRFDNQHLTLDAGELLMVASADVVGGLERGGFSQEALLKLVLDMQDEHVSDITDHLARMLPMLDATKTHEIDRSLILLRRRF